MKLVINTSRSSGDTIKHRNFTLPCFMRCLWIYLLPCNSQVTHSFSSTTMRRGEISTQVHPLGGEGKFRARSEISATLFPIDLLQKSHSYFPASYIHLGKHSLFLSVMVPSELRWVLSRMLVPILSCSPQT